MVDYIRQAKNNSKICVGVVIFVLFLYMLYTIPIPTIAATILVGNEAIAIFGFQRKKTIPIYVHIVLNYLCLIFMCIMATTQVYDSVMGTEYGVIDYQKICYKLMFSASFVVYVCKGVFARAAFRILIEEQSVLVPLVSNPV